MKRKSLDGKPVEGPSFFNRREFMAAVAASAAVGGLKGAENGEAATPILAHDAPPRNRNPYKDVDWSAAQLVKTTSHVHCKTQDDLDVLLKRGDDGSAASLRQTAVGLEVGRMYCLETLVFDAKDVRTGTFGACKVPLAVTLSDGAEICAHLSWTHDGRRNGRKVHGETHHICRHHIVFTAKARQVDVILSATDAPRGSEMGVNFVALVPYFPGKPRSEGAVETKEMK